MTQHYFEGQVERPPPPAVLPVPLRMIGPLRTLYFAAALMALLPLASIGAALWPLEPFLLAWRYASFGALAGVLLGPVLALIVACTLAGLLDDRPIQLLSGRLALVAGVLLLALDLLFVADYLYVREAAEATRRGSIDSAAWRSMFDAALSGCVLVATGRSALRSVATPPPGTILKKGERVGLVVRNTLEKVPADPPA